MTMETYIIERIQKLEEEAERRERLIELMKKSEFNLREDIKLLLGVMQDAEIYESDSFGTAVRIPSTHVYERDDQERFDRLKSILGLSDINDDIPITWERL